LRLSIESQKSLEQMCSTYQGALTPEALSYLRGRGLSDHAIGYFRLGVVSGYGEHAAYRGMLSIPYITELAGVVGFKFREPHTCTDACDHPKYLTPYPTRIYNAKAFAEAERVGYIGICEGEFDAMIAHVECGIPTVGVPGVKTWDAHKEWPLLFQGFGRVLVFKDQDKPGEELAKRIVSDVPAAEVVDMHGLGKDVNEIFLAHGRDALREVANV
jgi:DNA primase